MRLHLGFRWVLVAFSVLIVTFGFRTYEAHLRTSKICEEVENLKVILRPDPFDRAEIIQTLRDLNINPDSVVGKRLLKTSKQITQRERAELAPRNC